MGKISILDCTLRDGGYINDWRFGQDAIDFIINQLDDSGIEYIEIGFIKGLESDPDRSLYPSIEAAGDVIKRSGCRHQSKYVAMIDMKSPLPLDRVRPFKEGGLDLIRVIFRQDLLQQGFEYIKALSDKGYKVMVQMVSTDTYSDLELVDAIRKFNTVRPFAIYIVDTLGLMKKKDLMRIAYIFDNNLDEGIALGYHSHNNLQQARGNAEALVEANLDRGIVIDACVFGMGRGAGNLNEELFADYLNEYYSKDYRIEPMLEIIDRYLNDIYKTSYWGYSLPYYLSAKNRAHPNYSKYFYEKGDLSEREFDELLRTIKVEDRHVFDKDKAEGYYAEYRMNHFDDEASINELSRMLGDSKVFVDCRPEGSGDHKTIATNSHLKDPDLIFISSDGLEVPSSNRAIKIITSNVKAGKDGKALVFDRAKNISSDPNVYDDPLMMVLRILRSCGKKEVTISMDDRHKRSKGFERELNKLRHEMTITERDA